MLSTNDRRQQIESVVTHLKDCRSILFITGAGLSADSNLPTYRGIGGLYESTHTDEGFPIEEALSGNMMRHQPAVSWKYISQIESACRGAQHNPGHKVIAEMEAHFPRVWVLTQNVDGFHHEAGSRNVIDIHGNLRKLVCSRCHRREQVCDYSHIREFPPICPSCKGPMRPDVVLFGEMLPFDKVGLLSRILAEGFQMIFSIGTSSVFPYIVEPIIDARRWKVPTVEINPGETDISKMVDIKIPNGAAETLTAIWEAYRRIA